MAILSAKMTLGSYQFEWNPKRYTIPKKQRYYSVVDTYSDVAFFDWGSLIDGQQIMLEWDFMMQAQFNQFQDLMVSGEQLVWAPISGESPTYNVEVCALDGKYFEGSIHDAPYRLDVRLLLMIDSEV